jgi:hypothetical protein
VLLVLALNGGIASIALADQVDAHILALQSQTAQDVIGHILQPPDLRIASDVLHVENTELLEDISAELCVETCAKVGHAVRRLLVPRPAFLDELLEEG